MASVALYSPSVLSEAASGHRLPSLPVALAFVRACGGDPQEWEQRWREIHGDTEIDSAAAVPSAPVAADPARAASELKVRPAQMPIGPHDFVGRAAELRRASEVTGGPGDLRVPLVIRGPAGIGKTTFAMRFARRLASDFPGGQLWADMGADDVQPLDVMTGFLLALGVPPEQIPPDEMGRVGLYRSTLAVQRVVVLLDNVRDEPQVRLLLVRSCTSQILMTSRSRLLGLEGIRRITLAPLTPKESVELLRLLIGADRVRAELPAVLRIAQFCAHLPLALTIAGRKIAAQKYRPLSEFAAHLDSGVEIANWLWIGDVSLVQSVLPAYILLPPLAQQAVHRLAVSTDEITPGALAKSLQVSIDSAEYAMDALIDAGLLYRMRDSGRHVLPALIGRLIAQETSRLALRREVDTVELPVLRYAPADAPRY
ncbi:NB-ARC domain-containing protein [Nocardia sp. NPDC101769]|uniref:NB-ARC domain-containing protein n=1 Tax=Nocardia sp. NPDC101769 TaxID=3364333 RepID=UPI003807401D